ncbi:MAG TPA: glycosyl transferase family protein, partial [Betaproteobacteria bacterium]|nr:glycosyl transferase family protein [Betaproteobacteria bacterium]
LIRVKEETPQELAGFVRAAREALPAVQHMPAVDIDWSSYAGKRRHLPWFLLSAMLLASSGAKIFMHGLSGRKDERVYTPEALTLLGIPPCGSLGEAADRLNEFNFAFVALKDFSPKLDEIIELRPVLGLRSPVHTLSRLLNPFNAPVMLQGIFHPGYRDLHQETGLLLDQPHMAVIKGDGGEIERDPDVPCLVKSVHDGQLSEEEWPPLFGGARHVKEETLDASRLLALWRGELEDEYGQAAVVGTAAIALRAMGKADSIDAAQSLAIQMWDNRPVGWLRAA